MGEWIGKALLLLIGGWMVVSSGTCMISEGFYPLVLLFGIPFFLLGVWLVRLALRPRSSDSPDGGPPGSSDEARK
jgi:hypothetical protein